jgi:hypothetical protein
VATFVSWMRGSTIATRQFLDGDVALEAGIVDGAGDQYRRDFQPSGGVGGMRAPHTVSVKPPSGVKVVPVM